MATDTVPNRLPALAGWDDCPRCGGTSIIETHDPQIEVVCPDCIEGLVPPVPDPDTEPATVSAPPLEPASAVGLAAAPSRLLDCCGGLNSDPPDHFPGCRLEQPRETSVLCARCWRRHTWNHSGVCDICTSKAVA